ncbi:DUF3426 domain-containing protein [Saccharospirillum impatiens]|uniref:DUF3426 domain-containing protein n=1 Tax=Saccharospirillum impatiens TaxID=169438 RepID=UPI000423F710|nr:DUF3426 domain-containing protein [Saccharospirillum impatiens]
MAETFITQCPHCGTSFRVSDEQLSIANGSVRCGACLQVFSARNHIVTAGAKSKPAARPATPTAPKKPGTAAKQPVQRQNAPAPKAATKAKPKAAPPASKPKPAKPTPPSRFAADEDDDADFLFADNPEEDQEFVFQDSDDDLYDQDDDDSELGDLSDSFISLNNPSSGRKSANPFQREADDERETLDDPETADESWAESILEEMEREETRDTRREEKARFVSKPVSDSRPVKRQPAEAEPAWSVDDSGSDDFDSVDFSHIDRRADDTASASSVVRRLNHDIDLDFNAEDRLARWRWLGAVFIVLLIGVLVAQLAWVQRDTYAKMDQWRGLYQGVCDIAGCTLPDQEDIDLVRTSNVLIRDHRALNDVKLLDAVLTNRAAFRQPFPVLILQYTDVNGELIADQSFTPEQYLRGELTGTRLMPVNTRIYVSLPIRNPGTRAVNYQLVLAPAGTG